MSERPPVRLDADRVECHVFTFKEGVLSAIAHDLKVRVEKPSLTLDPSARTIEARFEANSLRVVCAMRDGREDPSVLSASDRHKIEENLRDEVLHTSRHPEVTAKATWTSSASDRARIEGTLHLHGVSRPFSGEARAESGRWTVEVRVHQPDFGIKPYSAMLGTLKVKPDVIVRVSVPTDAVAA